MIVEARKREHDDEPENEPANLLVMHAFEAAAGVGGRIDFKYAQGANGHEDGDQPPIVVARVLSGVFHRSFPSALAELVCVAAASFSFMATAGATTAVALPGFVLRVSAVTEPGGTRFFLS